MTLPALESFSAARTAVATAAPLAGRTRTGLPTEAVPLTAAQRILADELQARGQGTDALSMMVSSVARMVQAGRSCDSRWKAS